jgi:general secretion pathway protein C
MRDRGPRLRPVKGEAAVTQLNMQELISRWSSQPAEQLAAKASEHLPFWVSLILVILIAYYIARVVWLVYPASDEVLWMPPDITPSGPATATGNASQNYTAIAEAHIFGVADGKVETIVQESEDAPDTRLNLTLRAAISASDNDVAHAIIADDSGQEKVYFVSDPVPGGATLHRVQIDRVILNRGGVLEALRLPREFEGSKARSQSRRTAPSAPNPPPGNLQQLINANAATLSQIIRPQPFMPNGQFKGYRVFPGRNRRQFIALGLRPGDLVTKVNGVELNDPAQGMEVFSTLGTSNQMSVTVERGGRPQELTIDTSKLLVGEGGVR